VQPPTKEVINTVSARDARWYSFKPKIPIEINFGGPWNGKCWYNLCPFGICYGHLVYFLPCQETSGNPGPHFVRKKRFFAVDVEEGKKTFSIIF
jgi:hypothetical protein